ncbi:hypothetical protein [Conexibacter woesei]|uniref:hypothetical protein n=1 Tax=Conexibacter woesei TaxID=191495 RepID=UPI00040A0E77|nr:hypothetical protein [Conexibacter woesei]
MRPTLTGIEQVLADAGGIAAPRERLGQLRLLLGQELQHGKGELALARSGYEHPVVAVVASTEHGLVAVAPVALGLRADPDVVEERAWLLTAALVGALADASEQPQTIEAGTLDGEFLAIRVMSPLGPGDPELAPLSFADEQTTAIDRLKALLLAVPPELIDTATDFKPPIGSAHPLNVALEIAKLGGRPADPASSQELEDQVLAALDDGSGDGFARPHDDPDPSRRVARRILQRLDGMGKWGGYHTDFTHLARGFAGNDRGLADSVGEALLAAGLLSEKPSVGQRHVFLNPKRAGDIRNMIEKGDVPPGLRLPN